MHYKLWNAEIYKIQLALQRQTLKLFWLRESPYLFEISRQKCTKIILTIYLQNGDRQAISSKWRYLVKIYLQNGDRQAMPPKWRYIDKIYLQKGDRQDISPKWRYIVKIYRQNEDISSRYISKMKIVKLYLQKVGNCRQSKIWGLNPKKRKLTFSWDLKKLRKFTESKKIESFEKAQAGFGGFEHELLKKLHYELWNAEILKIQLALQRQIRKILCLRDSPYFFEISRQKCTNYSWLIVIINISGGSSFRKNKEIHAIKKF